MANLTQTGAEVQSLLDMVGKMPVVRHDASDTAIELTPNVLHKWDNVSSLAITLPSDEDGVRSEYKAVFIAGEEFSLSVPTYCRWANDEIPEFEAGKQYEMSIFDRRILISSFGTPATEGELLEYVENDGMDYILTDVIMSTDMYGMRCKSAPLFDDGQTTNYAIAGTRAESGTASGTSFFMWYLSGTQGRMLYWNGSNKTAFGTFTNGTVYEDEWTDEQNNVASDYPLIVFGGNNVGTPTYNNKFRFYYLEFLDADGNALVSLRPFKRASDGAIGIIDSVSGVFYPSVNGTLIGA